jgi:hypothetical protein
MERFGLRDDQWDRIKDILPGRERRGPRRLNGNTAATIVTG